MLKRFNFHGVLTGFSLFTLIFGLYLVLMGAPSTQKDWTPLPPVEAPYRAAEAKTALRKSAIASHLAALYRVPLERVQTYVELAWAESAKHPNVTPELILAVIQKESSLRPKAQSGYGAQGLMQIVRRWHPEKLTEAESLMEARVNIRVGATILQEYINKKGNLRDALVKYSGNASGYAEFVLHKSRELQMI